MNGVRQSGDRHLGDLGDMGLGVYDGSEGGRLLHGEFLMKHLPRAGVRLRGVTEEENRRFGE